MPSLEPVPALEPIRSLENVKFLLVDDLDANLEALEGLLRRDGLELHRARSGVEGLELLLQHDFALAFLDVHMSGMDGFELAELMRSTERTSRVPIIFVTAGSENDMRRFRGYEAGAVDYLQKPIDPIVLHNKASVFFDLYRQRQEIASKASELERTAGHLSDALARLHAHGDNSLLAVVEFNAAFEVVQWSKGAERTFGWRAEEVLGKSAAAIGWVTGEAWTDLKALWSEMGAGQASRDLRVVSMRRRDGVPLECEWYTSALLDGSSRLVSVNALIVDITERSKAHETQQLLIGELNHRVKNTLATVQAIATQTLRHSASPGDFAANFSGRIQSLSRAHALLSNATWRGARLSELINDQLRLGTDTETRVKASGPEVYLPSQMAMHLALILHELGTNARKYGALSVAAGVVSLEWHIEKDRLHLVWRESGGPPVSAPTRRGFGTSLIEKSIQAEGGNATPLYRAGGLTWDIDVPLPKILPIDTPDRPEIAAPLVSYQRQSQIAGKRILVVEDEPLVALELASILEDSDAVAVGPAASADHAISLIESATIDAALLDGNLHGQPVDAIAAALTRRNVPFIFVTGYAAENLPRPSPAPRC